MRVISKKTLVIFFSKHASAKGSLEAWYGEVVEQSWDKPEDIIRLYSTADVITGKRFVFNIKGNHYRLIVDVEFKLKIVFIVWVGTHAEYDKIKVEEISYVKNN
ncbi:type II toxin-antitoxin system HigB family toxin [Pedobacter jejuensis]|uniref:Type II toxin-antitoxin system HigB family toxin n=1 Tax=Pedobacter jejuensis TaxID=1268550 RepID=A0A3N0BQM9_9SPHI|nr:type II toxin-antitoxin system HigB family toxin [Pedobacter jejuensis]RNL51303.1 type II toxin-antitoxin system HigB family toxin [Pedobacter jejuensis]